ncbi:MAG: SCO family protein [Planctomycetota bacterium]
MRIPIIMTLILCVLMAIGITTVAVRTQGPVPITPIGEPLSALAFQLHDANGAKVTAESLRGKISILYFGYTFCPDVCPTELAWMTRVLHALGSQASQIQPILVGLDPERDTPARLRDYAAMFDTRIRAVTGSVDEVTTAATACGVGFRKSTPVSKSPGFYLIDHSMSTIVLNRDGRIAFRVQSRDSTPDQAAAQIRTLLEHP